MKLPRRNFLHLAAGAGGLLAVSRVAWAQTYPTRPVRILVGYSAGSASDILARLIAQWLSERLGQQFVVESRPGAGGNIAAEAVVRSAPDGYTLLLPASPDSINGTLYQNLNFNVIRDIAPVAGIVRVPNVMVVHPSFPAKTVPEFFAYAKTNPGKITMASAGVGSTSHMSGELFKMMAAVNMVHVPYRGQASALTDLLGGRVQVDFATMPPSIEYIRAGKLRALAVTSATRSEALPDVPTIGDFLPGYEVTTWFGIGAPSKPPVEIIMKLNNEINAALADPKIRAQLADLGSTALLTGSPADFGRYIAYDVEKWAKVVKFSGAKAD
jgi:tripartite-type tricarboxylate transporter receptor subunit TctC